MKKILTVMRSGNSAVVALPKEWRRAHGVDVGDKIDANFSASGDLSLRKASDDTGARKAAFESLVSLTGTFPDIPWDDDSKEADKALVGERYV